MDLVNENLIIDSIDNQKLSYEQVSNVLKETFPSVQGLSSQSVRWFYSERSISSRVSSLFCWDGMDLYDHKVGAPSKNECICFEQFAV